MTNLEEMNSNPNPKPLSYIGAALVGFILQAVLHLNLSGAYLASIILMFGYILAISIMTTYAEKTDNKFLLHFNEFWITLDQLMKNKMIELVGSSRI